MRGTRIVIPHSLRSEVLRLAQEGHQGIMKMKTHLRTKGSCHALNHLSEDD